MSDNLKASLALIPLFLLFVSIQNGTGQTTSINKAVAERYFEEVVNNRKLDLLDKIYADSFLVHVLNDSTESYKTIATQRDFLTYLFTAFPDIHYTIGDIFAEEDRVVMRVTLTATHKNEFWGYKASGNRIRYLSEIFFFRFENGRIRETWVQLDLYTLFKRLASQ